MPSSVSVIMALALVFYTVGVWSERLQGRLQWWHVVFFILGLVCDTVGTGMMFAFVGGMQFDFHGVTGLLAIVLMLVHAAWAVAVLLRRDAHWIARFHRFSVLVWAVWLIPYLSPMFLAMSR